MSAYLPTVNSFLKGCHQSNVVNTVFDSPLKGSLSELLSQVILSSYARESICQSFGLNLGSKYLIYLVPVGIEGAKRLSEYLKAPPLVKRSITLLQDHYKHICLVAITISNLSLLIFGDKVYAAAALSITAISLIKRVDYLSPTVKTFYRRTAIFLSAGYLFLISNPYGRITLSIMTAYSTFQDLFPKQKDALQNYLFRTNHFKKVPFADADHTSQLTPYQFDKIMLDQAILTVDKKHIEIDPYPVVNDVDYTALNSFCENVNMSSAFRQELNPQVVENLRKKTLSFIEKVKNKSFKCSINYEILSGYLGLISKMLPKITSEKTPSTQLPIILALNDNEPEQKVSVSETISKHIWEISTPEELWEDNVYQMLEKAVRVILTSYSDELPLKQRVLFLLQEKRLDVVKQYHEMILTRGPAIHVYYIGKEKEVDKVRRFSSLLETTFGLPELGLDLERGLKCRFIFRWLIGVSADRLWNIYTILPKNHPIQCILDNINIGRMISENDLKEWASKFSKNVNLQDPEIRKKVVKAMLVDMGVLKLN